MLPLYQIISVRVRPTDNLDANADSNTRWYRGVDFVVPQIEVFKMNPVLQVTTQFPIQGRPQQILHGRLMRLGMHAEF